MRDTRQEAPAWVLKPKKGYEHIFHVDAGLDDYVTVEGLNAEANARLIAAAPDMLAALKASRLYVETLEKYLDPVTDPSAPTIREHASMVRAAIAAAEGRSDTRPTGEIQGSI